MRVLCVAEKPSVAKSIATILSGGQYDSRNSPVRFIKNMDFSYRLNANGGPYTDFTVTAVAGHLTSSDFTSDHRKWGSCDPYDLLDARIVSFVSETGDMQGIAKNLKQEARTATELMIWTDCDREGEHIGMEVADVCRSVNRNIKVTRARFSAIIAAQIHRAARNTVQLDMRQARAVQARMELDLRIGAALTRLQTTTLQRKFEACTEKIVSYGSCQFPTLGFVVDQYRKVKDFVPEDFWYIFVSFERDDFNVQFRWKRNHLFDHAAVTVLFEQCVLDPEATVTNVVTRPTSKWKPFPLTTVELQKQGSRLLRLPPKQVLEAAESLYQKGLVSYPRTETDQFDPAFNFHELIERQQGDPAWGQFATMLLQGGGYERPKMGKKNDKAHPPIHPVQAANGLAGDEKRVYEYIVRRYLACCSKNATGAKTEVDIEIAGVEQFSASGLIVHQRNYLDVFPYDRWEGMHIPNFQRGEKFMPSVCEMREGQTTRPSLLTEADLVTLMDKNGIGTDATIAQHIATIIDRTYAMRQNQGGRAYLVPSTLGIGLIEGYNRMGFEKSLSKPFLRAETEQRMEKICTGERTKEDVVYETVEEYRDVYMRTKQQINTLVSAVRDYLEGRGDAAPQQGVINGPPEDDDDYDDGFNGNNGGGGGGHNGGGAGRGGRGGRGGGQAQPRQNNNRRQVNNNGANYGGGNGGPPPPAPRRPPARRDPEDDDENDFNGGGGGAGPMCRCGEPAVERTVSKEGPNTGRKFWACPKQREEGCGFFEWQDGPSGGGGQSYGSSFGALPQNNGNKRGYAAMNGGDPLIQVPRCQCDLVAAEKTTTKEGPNKGRVFFVCSKVSKQAQCKFFEWADESGGGQGGSRGGLAPMAVGNGNAGGSGGGGASGSCFSCGEDGHWSSNCPTKAAGNARGGGGGGGGSGGECFTCGSTEHWSRDCPQKGQGNGGGGGGYRQGGGGGPVDQSNYTCYKCGQEGHWASSCTNEGDGGPPAKQGRGGSRARGRGRGSRGGRGKSSRGGGAGRGRKKKASAYDNSDDEGDGGDGYDYDMDF